jgi:hypothetical protein
MIEYETVVRLYTLIQVAADSSRRLSRAAGRTSPDYSFAQWELEYKNWWENSEDRLPQRFRKSLNEWVESWGLVVGEEGEERGQGLRRGRF